MVIGLHGISALESVYIIIVILYILYVSWILSLIYSCTIIFEPDMFSTLCEVELISG